MTPDEIIHDLAAHLEASTDHEIRTEEHGVVVEGDFEMFGAPDVKAEITRFMTREHAVSSYTVGVQTPAGSLTGPLIVDEIEVSPHVV